MTSTLLQSRTNGTRMSLKCRSTSAHPSGDVGSFGACRIDGSAAAHDGGVDLGADDTGDA